MDFVIDNYLWFIVGGIVLLMIVIGFFAEKTDFGRKPLRKKKEKTENKNVEPVEQTEEVDMSEIENKGINDVLSQSQDELTDSIDSELPYSDIENNLTNALPELSEEDLNVPFGDAEVKLEEESSVETPDIPEVIEDEQESEEDDVWKF